MARETIIIDLHLSEVLYDVYNKAYLMGRSKYTGENYRTIANMQANEDSENKNQLLRSIGNAFAEIKRIAGEYLYEDCNAASNELQEDDVLSLCLLVSGNFNIAMKDNIAMAMHQYLVNTALYDWFTITNKEDANDYLQQAANNSKNIRESLYQRVRPLRP